MIKDYLTDQEWIDSLNIVEHIKTELLIEELNDFARRELELIKNGEVKEDLRIVLVYNVSILAAAAARLKSLTDSE